jgi:hypothetical protein
MAGRAPRAGGVFGRAPGDQRRAADALLDRSADLFLGIHKTLCWFIGDRLPPAELEAFLEALASGAAQPAATRH